jgi:hypothetical protein
MERFDVRSSGQRTNLWKSRAGEALSLAKNRDPKDWAGSWEGLALIWGLPAAIMAASSVLAPAERGIVWTLMLAVMGGACLVNARRCNRTHCRYTGPFLILTAALVALYTLGLLPLGSNAWGLLASIAFGGSAILCCASESLWGRYRS